MDPHGRATFVMGIAGAGNSGTLMSTLFAPRLAEHYGWHTVFGLALIPLSIVFLVWASMPSGSLPSGPRPSWPER